MGGEGEVQVAVDSNSYHRVGKEEDSSGYPVEDMKRRDPGCTLVDFAY